MNETVELLLLHAGFQNPNRRDFWDKEAASSNDEPDLGLRDPVIRKAWTNRLLAWLLAPPGKVLDIGCGTGSLRIVLASLGYEVRSLDCSSTMVAQARAKAQACRFRIGFRAMDAASSEMFPQQFDVLVCRNLLWALPIQKKLSG